MVSLSRGKKILLHFLVFASCRTINRNLGIVLKVYYIHHYAIPPSGGTVEYMEME